MEFLNAVYAFFIQKIQAKWTFLKKIVKYIFISIIGVLKTTLNARESI